MRTFDFATIGFRPFPETQEFVTIGGVAMDTAARHFDFVLQDARTAQQAVEQEMARLYAVFCAMRRSCPHTNAT